MPRTKKVKSTLIALLATVGMAAAMAGCDLFGPIIPLPLGQITSVQLFEEPNFTMAFSVADAVAKPEEIAKVRWVFGDGSGFVEGPPNVPSITHRYDAPGSFEVTAFLFDADGFVDQITTTINVEDDGQGPGPDPTPEDLPEAATSPFPTDGAEDVPVDTTLSWLPGLLAESHDIYLGTIQNDVENAATTDLVNFRGNQTELQFDPEGLDPDTEYFWRVDEVNEAGTTKGTVFSFRTAEAPELAESPEPANGSSSARVDQVLQWVAGTRATSHDVYFGKDATAVTDATTETTDIFQGNQGATSFDPEDDTAVLDGQLLADTEYFWRIDEVGSGGTTKGTVWSFRTQVAPPMIMTPAPADTMTDVGLTQIISWTASPSVESFDVYLGIGTVDVDNATRTSTEFRGNQTTKNFDPAPLIGGTQYFWRIDTLGPGGTAKGDVLSFTTAGPPGQVTGPFTPANGASNVDIETMLLWSPGGGTTIFEVFLSTNSNAVLNRQAAALQSSQDVSLTSFEPTSALDPGTQYFWSIDAIGPGGTTAGAVLSFTTGNQPQLVENPDPTIGATGVALDKVLAWDASVGAASYDVYFDTNQSSVQNADLQSVQFRGNVATTTFMPGSIFPNGLLDGDTQYFWRIDAKGPGGTTTGDVFSFTTGPDQVTDPMPMNDDLGVDVNTELSWTASSSATSYDVYLGTVLADVESATNADLTGIFRDNVTVTNFDPAGLMAVTDYYWRIDAVDDTGTGGTTKGEVWKFTTGAGQTADPTPANGASGVSLTPMLDWTVGTGAVDQDIYFGTDQSIVENADRTSPDFQGTFPVAGGPPPFNPSPLDGITAYFWRVDSVTADGTTTGEVWQFITGPDKATSPMPAIFETDVSLTALLQWTAGNGAASHDVYLITETDDMALPMAQQIANADNTNVPPFVANVVLTTFDPGMLLADTVYLWRIDEVAADGTTISQGDVWRFTTLGPPDQAGSPMPFNGATDIDPTMATLNWAAADGATSYDVFFGTTMTPASQGNQTTRSFNPGTLADNTTYFWRIDAVNEAGTTPGVLWSFTTTMP